MKLKLMVVLGIGLLAAQVHAVEQPAPKTLKEKMSYGIGVSIVRNFRQPGIDLDPDMLIKGIRDALSGEKLLMTDQDIRITIAAMQNELKQKQLEHGSLARKSYTFLSENKNKQDVMSLPSGLQYRILKEGNGKKPTDADTVEVIYRGTHIDGSEFDNSNRNGKPAIFKVRSEAIPGLFEALKLMPTGSKWQVFIPPHLAYGEQGLKPNILPFETLIYEVELLDIK